MSPGRRGLLLGLGSAGAAAAVRAATLPDNRPDLPVEEADGTADIVSFYGPHQAGITTPQPAAALLAAFDVLAEDRAELVDMFRLLTERCAFLTAGGAVAELDPKLPPLDSGVLGPRVFPDALSVTVAVGASLFDDRFGLQAQRPRALVEMTGFPNDALDAEHCHGDLLLQFNANTAETNIHALRDILKYLPEHLALRWKMEGFLPPHTIKKQARDTVRNLMGFKDGTANLDSRDTSVMDRLVWTAADEPGWTTGGSYQVVRLIRMLVERWDRTPLGEQQTIFGRDKAEGAALGLAKEHDVPDYAADPAGKGVPLDAHIRLANPRSAETQSSLILRRAYNYSRGLTKAGQLDMGLIFGCFQADLAAGFLTVQSRLNGEALEEYIKPFGGGYFFALPGVTKPGDSLGRALLAA
ncbi:MAG: iron uptake transporter deferrochelatase/peroxidase subunit [Janthinobacterium lividum]